MLAPSTANIMLSKRVVAEYLKRLMIYSVLADAFATHPKIIVSTRGVRVVRMATLILVSTMLPALAGASESAESFVRRVYALYRTSDDPGVPMDRPGGAAYYTPALLDAFAKDSALAHGEIGAIDSDPICACQAYDKLRIRTIAITGRATDTAKARVEFDNIAYHEIVTLTLSRTPAGWRIADVGNRTMKSVMAVLRKSNAHSVQPSK